MMLNPISLFSMQLSLRSEFRYHKNNSVKRISEWLASPGKPGELNDWKAVNEKLESWTAK
jgi:hypothetical protein